VWARIAQPSYHPKQLLRADFLFFFHPSNFHLFSSPSPAAMKVSPTTGIGSGCGWEFLVEPLHVGGLGKMSAVVEIIGARLPFVSYPGDQAALFRGSPACPTPGTG
jgi:hypothetical protein